MNRALLLPGVVLSLIGLLLSAEFTFAGPTLPDGPVEVLGWVLLLAGLAELTLVARLTE